MKAGKLRGLAGCGARCQEARRHVHRLLDERLTPARRRVLLRHMRACPACFTVLEFARIMRAVLRSAVCAEGCPKALERKVRRAVRSA